MVNMIRVVVAAISGLIILFGILVAAGVIILAFPPNTLLQVSAGLVFIFFGIGMYIILTMR